ncbi:MAG: helix-turn-helix domain-containing protein [Fusicatenibacter sp.]|nr:helix-turn-helix domain-containing protein [Lachnospiraceae bacterium]MDY2936893.1 helix-turn-helix domain-containing protein [Fusicatenibacter sp.]
MGIQLGKKIRELRLKKSVTQEQLASVLGISSQAVSKWENDLAMPDIQILPELSVYFGVTIDELFNLSKEDHYDRIENLCLLKELLSPDEFRNAEDYLKTQISMDKEEARPWYLLSVMYNRMADGFREKAADAAKRYIELEPKVKWGHSQLNIAQHGSVFEWSVSNHSDRIQYYKKFVAEHPDYAKGYLWLLDDLIADWRLEEADAVLQKLKKVQNNFLILLYQGQIAWYRGNHEEAFRLWHQMELESPGEWLVFSDIADCLTRNGEYEKAISYYQKSMELAPKPRFTDDAMSIAQIYEILNRPDEAIRSWKTVLSILSDEWDTKEGREIDRIYERIRRLEKGKGMYHA